MESSVDTETEESTSEGVVPIREISRVTGVNTVTLRAWERRYGLLIPQRTSKGHRLYSLADIERVREIQVWLGRGLAIGKVRALLAEERRGENLQEIDSIWLQLMQQIQLAITAFNRNQLESLIEETFALYPVAMIADYLLAPLLIELQGDESGKPVRRAFFATVLLEYIQAAQNRQRQVAQGEQVLLVSASAIDNTVLPQVWSYSLLVNQYRADFLGYLPPKEAILGAEVLKAKIVVIVGGETLGRTELQLHLNGWRERSAIPVVLAGSASHIFRALRPEVFTGVYACDNLQQVLVTINQLLKD